MIIGGMISTIKYIKCKSNALAYIKLGYKIKRAQKQLRNKENQDP